jgi:hypothetical protein
MNWLIVWKDETILHQTNIKAHDSPDPSDLHFLRKWIGDPKLGNRPLLGRDSDLWENSQASSLIALKARKGDDAISSLLLHKMLRWWHYSIGHRIKKPRDVEMQYVEYEDRTLLRIADIMGSIISSGLLVGGIVALYFVENMLLRLGIVGVFTQVFSLAVVLVTRARKVEMFAATAAWVFSAWVLTCSIVLNVYRFVAVQVVFVGSTYNPATTKI